MSDPASATSRSFIIPRGALAALDFELQWRNGQCRLHDDEVREGN